MSGNSLGTRAALGLRHESTTAPRSDEDVCHSADESQLWLELLPEADPAIATAAHKAILGEASELTAIFTATYRTAKSNLKKRKAQRKKGRAE